MDEDEDSGKSFLDILNEGAGSFGKIYSTLNPPKPAAAANTNAQARQSQLDVMKILPWAIGGVVALLLLMFVAGSRR